MLASIATTPSISNFAALAIATGIKQIALQFLPLPDVALEAGIPEGLDDQRDLRLRMIITI